MFYDPTRINKRDIENTDVVARIPVKQEGYGQPLSEAVYSSPYRDESVPQILDVARQVSEMADIANGQNRVQRGQFQKGNKTRFEFQETMNNGDSRPRMIAKVLEGRYFTPIKVILKTNILQFQPPAQIYDRVRKESISIDPTQLRSVAMEFKIADGARSTEQYVGFDTFKELFNAVQTNPMLATQYDVIGAFFYWLKLQGASWLDDFRIQQPAPGAMPGAAQPASAGTAPGQVPTSMPNPTANGVPLQ
jgi:hypothetical protein